MNTMLKSSKLVVIVANFGQVNLVIFLTLDRLNLSATVTLLNLGKAQL